MDTIDAIKSANRVYNKPMTAYIIVCEHEVDIVEESRIGAINHLVELAQEGFTGCDVYPCAWADQDEVIDILAEGRKPTASKYDRDERMLIRSAVGDY